MFCIYNFVGKGYTDEFVINFQNIVNYLNDNKQFQIIDSLDSICFACPKHDGKVCEQQSKVKKLDQKVAELLNIKIGTILNWKQAQQLIKNKINSENFNEICSDCEWFTICKNLRFD